MNTLPTLSTTATSASSVAGSPYAITASGAVNANYTISYVAGSLTVTPLAITVTVDAQSKMYGNVDPTLTYQITSGSLVPGDAFTGTLSRTAGENVGTYSINRNTLALNSNYALTYTAANLTIVTRAIAVTANAQNKSYGDTDPALTYTYTGTLAFSDTFTGGLSRVSGENVGTYAINQNNLALSSNYALTYTGANLTIGTRAIAVTADAKTKTYGDADPTLTYQVTSGSLVTGDRFTGAITRAPGENVGTYTINRGSLALSSNYALTYTGANLTIGTRAIAVTADAKTKTYGDADPTLTYTYTGTLATGDAFTGALSRAAGQNIGTYAINQNTLALSSNYALTYTGANLTISTRAITVTADAKSKTYGDVDPTLTYQITSGSLVTGDAFTGALSRAPGENIGTYAINQNTLVLNGNYALTYTGANLTIGTRAIAVTADAKSKTYGDADPVLTYTYTGTLVTGDAFTGLLSRAPGENIGTYAINQNTLALSSNYALTYTGANLTISTRAIAVTADAKSKTYGDADPTLTYTYTGTLATGDAFTGALSRAPGENIGTYAINQNTLVLNGNYALTYTGANLTIGTRAIAVTADAKSKTYGDADPALTYTYTGTLATGDAFTGGLSRAAGENIGTYAINQNSLALNSNYALTYTGANLTIGTRAIAVTADAKSKTYGDPDPALTYTYTGTLVTGDSFTGALSRAAGENIGTYAINQNTLALSSNYALTYTGSNLTIGTRAIAVTVDAKSKTYGDADPALTYQITSGSLVTGDAFTGALSRAVGENIGTYAINQNTLALNSNYALTYTGANLTIGTRAIALTADAKSKTYGDVDPTLTYTYSGTLVTGDSFTGSLSRSPGENIGTYAINQNTLALNSNYALTYTGANLTIGTRAITVTADAKSKTYGDADPAFTYTYTGTLVAGDAFTGVLARAAGENIGTYAINQNTLALSSNYALTYKGANLTIGTRAIAVTAAPKNKTYGDSDPALTYTYTGTLATGDSFTGTLSRTTGEGAGSYAINKNTLALGSNYTLTYTGATLVINKAPLSVTADNKSRLFLLANPPLTLTYSGFKFSDAPTSLTAQPSVTTTAVRLSLPGVYPITVQGAASSNYDITYHNGQLTVLLATRTIAFTALPQKTYGDPDFSAGASLNTDETLVLTSSNTNVATIVNGQIHIVGAGTTVITAAAPENGGYSTTDPISQILIVDKAQQTISFAAIPNLYSGDSYDLSSVKSSAGLPVTLTVADQTIASITGTKLNALAIGTTAVTASAAGNANYYPAANVTQPVKILDKFGAELIVRKALSPNGDGINDFLYIEGIKDHPVNSFTVINRNGVKIFEIKNYNNADKVFVGRSSVTGDLQTAGTYFYLIELNDGGTIHRQTGYFLLKYQN
ncbi:beta strand repeat-containing protein [Mucilaginibacter agri]|uniref:MBG domain-containing protein n=1 Tax=Mucilaginibacter agri TaxID=2695265 RepID=A0A965ZL48_9SPHI|nr:MBG domain-containing protein [Mucilaginibacter agri]NCD71671.1 hypothetical protein [Mucilaginibacter agri]